MTRTLLIDGDVIAYKVAASIERNTDWGDGLWTLHSDATEGVERLENTLADLMTTLQADAAVVALTDQEANFRLSFWPTYKAKRKHVRRPLCLRAMREHLLENHKTFLRPNLEGDDVLGILATHKFLVPGEKILVSADKDFFTIPGKFYRIAGKDPEVVDVTEDQADAYHLYQTLIGDSTDEYPGCPGVGPKKAEAILEKNPTWGGVVAAYEKAHLSELDALVQARCARILRAQDYDFNNKQPILWRPKAWM